MPYYDYLCPDCHTKTEIKHSMTETKKHKCKKCKKELTRVYYSLPAIFRVGVYTEATGKI